MGCGMSRVAADDDLLHDTPPSANANINDNAIVVSLTGDLRPYPIPITVSQALASENTSTSSAFLCHSDTLFFDDYIPALHPDHPLQPAQIYFLLPVSKLHYRLSASDMAALAVKATRALQSHSNNPPFPNLLLIKQRHHQHQLDHQINFFTSSSPSPYITRKQPQHRRSSGSVGFSRSPSIRKLQRFSSKRATMAVRSFKIRLTTIYEGSVLHFA